MCVFFRLAKPSRQNEVSDRFCISRFILYPEGHPMAYPPSMVVKGSRVGHDFPISTGAIRCPLWGREAIFTTQNASPARTGLVVRAPRIPHPLGRTHTHTPKVVRLRIQPRCRATGNICEVARLLYAHKREMQSSWEGCAFYRNSVPCFSTSRVALNCGPPFGCLQKKRTLCP